MDITAALAEIQKTHQEGLALRDEAKQWREEAQRQADDAHFYKERLAEMTIERDHFMMMTTELATQMSIMDQIATKGVAIARRFSAELSKRKLDRETEIDPSPLTPSQALLPKVEAQ